MPIAYVRGQRLLLAVLRVTSAREISVRCRVHETAVGKWAYGITLPSLPHRAQLQAIYRIPPSAWDLST